MSGTCPFHPPSPDLPAAKAVQRETAGLEGSSEASTPLDRESPFLTTHYSMTKMNRIARAGKNVAVVCMALFMMGQEIQSQELTIKRNKPEREAWFQSLGFGMFIHWSMDVQLGAIIGHNVAVASPDYADRYFNELPKTFNPKKFDPEEWAVLAKLAGMKYVVFVAKHHSGFCMWDSETTDFDIMNTRFHRDILSEVIQAFRKEGIAVGLYFSPDDFHFMYKQGLPLSRRIPEQMPANNPELWKFTQRQLKELLTKYGKIDILFLDEKDDWANTMVANYCWDVDPDLVISRGGMETPEQKLPDQALPGPWEACFTIGWQWQYVAGEPYKSATELIEMLIETRAKGGNLLLNVGPMANGELEDRQEATLREIALWHFTNHEAVENIEPWRIVREFKTPNNNDARMVKKADVIWFTKAKDSDTVYAFLPGENWAWMERKEFLIRTLKGSDKTRVSVLGQSQVIMENQIKKDPRIFCEPTEHGLFVSVVKAQRLNKRWSNPVVLKIENVEYQGVRPFAPVYPHQLDPVSDEGKVE
ncbi:MAG: alpha-L-fucosidase [Verrucomicrobiales bacterium]